MAILDIDGLLGGKRLKKCSAAARWAYPYFMLLANGYARIELDYEGMAEHFVSFRGTAPTAEDIEGYFAEYIEQHLIFVYSTAGKTWGQWDTLRARTQRHKNAADRRTPHPPEGEYQGWLREQHQDDWGKFHWNPTPEYVESQPYQSLQKAAENLREMPKSSADLCTGVGVGVGVGKNKKHKARTARPEFKTPEFVTPAIWEGFVEMRDRIRKPMTGLAVELITKRLIHLKNRGHPPDEVLKQSIVNTWQNVFELKESRESGIAGTPRGPVSNEAADQELERQFGRNGKK